MLPVASEGGTPPNDLEAETAQARQLLREGKLSESEAIFFRLADRYPDSSEVLTALGMIRTARGDTKTGVGLLKRALAVDGSNAAAHHALGLAFKSAGDFQSAKTAFIEALRLQPTLAHSRLSLGQVYQRLGDDYSAMCAYVRSIKDAQAQGRWLSDDSTEPALRAAVREAMQFTESGRRALFESLLKPLSAQYGKSELRRVEQCVNIYLGAERPPDADLRQQPTFLFFPGLRASPFIEKSLFPWAEAFEAQTAQIRNEMLSILPDAIGREQVFIDERLASQNLKSARGKPEWDGYYFYRHGLRKAENLVRCPATARALEQIPLVRIRDHGPESMFSVLAPGTHLLPHCGVTNIRSVVHLPLVIPADCALRVSGIQYDWKEGECVFFDDTFEHEAWNLSSSLRIVLITDIWNPGLTEVERDAVRDLIVAIGDFRSDCDRLN